MSVDSGVLVKVSFIVCVLLIICLTGLLLNKNSNLCACQEAYEASVRSHKMRHMERRKKTFFEFSNDEYLEFPSLEFVEAWCTCVQDKSMIFDLSSSIEKYVKFSKTCPIKLSDFLKCNINNFDVNNKYKLVGSYIAK